MEKIAIVFGVFLVIAILPCRGEPVSDSAEDLKKLMQGIVKNIQQEQHEKVKRQVENFLLPDYENWFVKVFGSQAGKSAALEYTLLGKDQNRYVEGFSRLLTGIVEKGQTQIQVSRFAEPSRETTGLQSYALKAMKKKVPLYSVRFLRPGEELGMHLWNFVYVKGNFRHIGKLRGVKYIQKVYPNTQKGLAALLQDIIKSMEKQEAEEFSRQVMRLVLPAPQHWFTEIFGRERGTFGAQEYTKDLGTPESYLHLWHEIFHNVVAKKHTEILVYRFAKKSEKATGLQNDALNLMKKPTPLYSVRLLKLGTIKGIHLWSFIYDSGNFYYVGNMQGVFKDKG